MSTSHLVASCASLIMLTAGTGCAACRSESRPTTALSGPAAMAPRTGSAAPDVPVASRSAQVPPSHDPELDEPPSRPAGTTRMRMQDHFEGLREIERAIVGGDLDGARDRATRIVFDRADSELPTWAPYIARMRDAAYELARAGSLREACRLEARLAVECARCHVASGAMPTFVVPVVPPDAPTPAARMARHQWAADRLWEGLIGLSDEAWRDGLAILAATPLPASSMSDDPDRQHRLAEYGRSLQRLARLAGVAADPAERARAYEGLLLVCTSCHAGRPAAETP